jgi:hypothetical protein
MLFDAHRALNRGRLPTNTGRSQKELADFRQAYRHLQERISHRQSFRSGVREAPMAADLAITTRVDAMNENFS